MPIKIKYLIVFSLNFQFSYFLQTNLYYITHSYKISFMVVNSEEIEDL